MKVFFSLCRIALTDAWKWNLIWSSSEKCQWIKLKNLQISNTLPQSINLPCQPRARLDERKSNLRYLKVFLLSQQLPVTLQRLLLHLFKYRLISPAFSENFTMSLATTSLEPNLNLKRSKLFSRLAEVRPETGGGKDKINLLEKLFSGEWIDFRKVMTSSSFKFSMKTSNLLITAEEGEKCLQQT